MPLISSFFGLNQFRNVAIYGCFFHEDWDKLSKEFEGSSSVIADVDCTAGGKSKCEEATLAVTSVMMILATVRPLGDFDGNPFKKILIFLTWVERNLGSEAMNCVSQKQIVPALSHLQTPRNPKWHPSETVAKIFIDNMFWQNAPGSFQLMQTNIFLNMFSPGGYPWIPYHQIWRSRWSSGKFCWQKKDVDTEGTSKDGEVCKGNWILMDFGGKSLWHIQSKLPCFFLQLAVEKMMNHQLKMCTGLVSSHPMFCIFCGQSPHKKSITSWGLQWRPFLCGPSEVCTGPGSHVQPSQLGSLRRWEEEDDRRVAQLEGQLRASVWVIVFE